MNVFETIMKRLRKPLSLDSFGKQSPVMRFERDARGFRRVYVNGVYMGAVAMRKSNYGVPVYYALNVSHMRISGSFRFCLRMIGALT